jgi:glucose-1-phosphate thymidylyltransferase
MPTRHSERLADPTGAGPPGPARAELREPARAEVVGLIPAAGRARRLGGLPGSKEVLPLGFSGGAAGPLPRLACDGLLGAFAAAGVGRAVVALGGGKWDVPAALGDGRHGTDRGVALAYVPVHGSRSVPESLDRARPFVAGKVVAMGFPDVWFEPRGAFVPLLDRLAASGADVALGCFPAPDPRITDMVDLGAGGEVRRIEVRPAASRLALNWLIAAWTPRFTGFLARAVAAAAGDGPRAGAELQLGAVFAAALEAGLPLVAVPFPEGRFRDLGTPGDLAAVWRAGGDPFAG